MKMPTLSSLSSITTLALLPILASGCWELVPPDGNDGGVDDFTLLYQSSTFQQCADCHAPGAPGFVNGTETTQDWTSRTTAFNSLKGNAAGLIGNFQGCNGVPLVGPTSSQSLIVAVFDPTVRASFSYPGFPGCTADAITDETLRVGPISSTDLARLKAFIDAGGFQ